jgi:hypothetical protein
MMACGSESNRLPASLMSGFPAVSGPAGRMLSPPTFNGLTVSDYLGLVSHSSTLNETLSAQNFAFTPAVHTGS